jgi:hypothetical protein
MKVIATLWLIVLLSGCTDSYIPNEVEERISDVLPEDQVADYIDRINGRYSIFSPEPIEQLSKSFVVRILGEGGITGRTYITEVIQNEDGTGTIVYREFSNERISVYRKEIVIEPIFRSLLELRTDLDQIMDFPMFQSNPGEYIADGYSWVLEAYDGKNRHFVFRISNTALEESFSTLLKELNRFEN